jgi:hypothetical protein
VFPVNNEGVHARINGAAGEIGTGVEENKFKGSHTTLLSQTWANGTRQLHS